MQAAGELYDPTWGNIAPQTERECKSRGEDGSRLVKERGNQTTARKSLDLKQP